MVRDNSSRCVPVGPSGGGGLSGSVKRPENREYVTIPTTTTAAASTPTRNCESVTFIGYSPYTCGPQEANCGRILIEMRRAVVMCWIACCIALPPRRVDAQAAVTKPPKLVQAIAPEYPAAALAANKQADVKVRLHIDSSGVVTAVDVVEPVGDGFGDAAVAAAMQYVFEPAEIDGRPGAIVVETTIHFTIEAPPAPPPPVAAEPRDSPPGHAGPLTEPVTVRGEVVERGTRRKLAGVIVAITPADPVAKDSPGAPACAADAPQDCAPKAPAQRPLDAVTDDQGAFSFHGVPPGTYQLLAEDSAHDRFTRSIALAADEALDVRLWMRPRGGNPYETVLEAERETLDVTKRTLERQQFRSIPGTFGDPIRAIQTLPGLHRPPFGVGFLLVRGSNPDDTGIFLDGHEVPALFHFLGGPSIFSAEMLESLTLYPGGFPGRYGRHHGGAVTLGTRPTATDGIHGSAKLDFIDAGGYVRAPVTDDLSVAIAGRRSYIDAFLGLVLPKPKSGGQRIVTPVYYDYQGRIDYNLHRHGRLNLFAIGSSDTLHVLNRDPETATSSDLNSAVKFLRVIGGYTRPLPGGLKLTVTPAWGRDTLFIAGAQAEATGPFTSLAIVNDTVSFRSAITGKLGSRLTLDAGIDSRSRFTRYEALVPIDDNLLTSRGVDIPPSELVRKFREFGMAVYVDLGIDVSSRLRLVPSLRGDAYWLNGAFRQTIDPRLSFRYRLDDQWTVKGYVGRYSQPPQPEALDPRFGNPQLGLERGEHYGLGYEWRPHRLWSLDSEVYCVRRHDLVVFTDDIADNGDGTFSRINFKNQSRNNSCGLEAIIKREISDTLFGYLSYTYSRARQKRSPTASITPTVFDQPHVMNAIASWKPGRGFELGARFQLASGRADTPVIGATYNADTGRYVAVRGATRSVRLPTFSQLDVRVERTWLFERWSLGLYLDIINVLNAKNVEAIQYDYRFRHSSPITSFPILPTLGVRGTW